MTRLRPVLQTYLNYKNTAKTVIFNLYCYPSQTLKDIQNVVFINLLKISYSHRYLFSKPVNSWHPLSTLSQHRPNIKLSVITVSCHCHICHSIFSPFMRWLSCVTHSQYIKPFPKNPFKTRFFCSSCSTKNIHVASMIFHTTAPIKWRASSGPTFIVINCLSNFTFYLLLRIAPEPHRKPAS